MWSILKCHSTVIRSFYTLFFSSELNKQGATPQPPTSSKNICMNSDYNASYGDDTTTTTQERYNVAVDRPSSKLCKNNDS